MSQEGAFAEWGPLTDCGRCRPDGEVCIGLGGRVDYSSQQSLRKGPPWFRPGAALGDVNPREKVMCDRLFQEAGT